MDECEQHKIEAKEATQLLKKFYNPEFNEIYEKNTGSKVSIIYKLFINRYYRITLCLSPPPQNWRNFGH